MTFGWIRTTYKKQALYIFLDEGGDFNFSPTGTKFYTLTSIVKIRPFIVSEKLHGLKYDLMEEGIEIQKFHASEDKQLTRNRVFEIIRRNLERKVIDSLIVDKRKTGPALQSPEKFYPKMIGYLLSYVLGYTDLSRYSEVIIITDSIPIQKKRKSVEKAIKITLRKMLPEGLVFRVMHHPSNSCFGLQIADYCNWAIYRKWQSGDLRSYNLIKHGLKSEFDIFKSGEIEYY